MKKKLFALLLALVMALSLAACGGSANPDRWEDIPDTEAQDKREDETVEVYGELYTGLVFTDGVIHAILNRTTGVLLFIGNGAIVDHDDWAHFTDAERRLVKTVVIGRGISSIGSLEFDGDHSYKSYPNLEEVIINANLNNIGFSAFSDNVNLSKVTFGDGGNCRHIDDSAFADCYALDGMDGLPSSVLYGYSVFRNCPFQPEGYTDGYDNDNATDWTALD